ncbi:MAG UNVERIFIED_CONTAM: tRNA-dihydrouridine synthase family protein [Planctomycetaceae bacterium]
MMCNTDSTLKLARTVVEAVRVPITVKMRLGWDATHLTAPFFAREFEQLGVAAVAIHGRTREQGFSGTVSLPGIRAVVQAVQRIPVVGNGDVRSVSDAARMIRETGCHAVSIGRAAAGKPLDFSTAGRVGTNGFIPASRHVRRTPAADAAAVFVS